MYVRPFPGPGGKWQVSTEGGRFPVWSRARPELFYRSENQRIMVIMVVPYTVDGDSFRPDRPRLWSESRFAARPDVRTFDLHPDGQRFAAVSGPQRQVDLEQNKVVFILNFFDYLRRIAPPDGER